MMRRGHTEERQAQSSTLKMEKHGVDQLEYFQCLHEESIEAIVAISNKIYDKSVWLKTL